MTKRYKLKDEEVDLLGAFLASDSTLDAFVDSKKLDKSAVMDAAAGAGLTLPEKGLAGTLTDAQRQIYLGAVSKGQDLFTASQTFGFDPIAAVGELDKTGLTVPLSTTQQTLFDRALDVGLDTAEFSTAMGVPQYAMELALAGARLGLPEKKQTGYKSYERIPARKSSNSANPFEMFNMIPQAPGPKLGFLTDPFKNETQTIFTSPRGVKTDAPTRVLKATGI